MGGRNTDTDSPREKLHPSHERVSEVTQSCLTLCDPVDCSPPGSSIHGILQARILEWVAISSSRESSWPRDQSQVSCISGRGFNLWATPVMVIHSQEGTQRCGPFPWGVRDLSSISDIQTLTFSTGKTSPRTTGFENQWRIHPEKL